MKALTKTIMPRIALYQVLKEISMEQAKSRGSLRPAFDWALVGSATRGIMALFVIAAVYELKAGKRDTAL